MDKIKNRRILQLNELIKRDLGEIFKKELGLKREILLTITNVEISNDLLEAKVLVSIFPFNETEQILEKIEKIKRRIEGLLNKKISLRVFLKLKFLIDETEEKADQIEKTLRDLSKLPT